MKFIIIILICIINFSCDNKYDLRLLCGIWKSDDILKGHSSKIVFEKLTYLKMDGYGDVVYISKGKYFYNENKERRTFTITLVPDLVFNNGNPIIIGCSNIDILKITDSTLSVLERIRHDKGYNWNRLNTNKDFIIKYKKISN
jgi:hypothetical protein